MLLLFLVISCIVTIHSKIFVFCWAKPIRVDRFGSAFISALNDFGILLKHVKPKQQDTVSVFGSYYCNLQNKILFSKRTSDNRVPTSTYLRELFQAIETPPPQVTLVCFDCNNHSIPVHGFLR